MANAGAEPLKRPMITDNITSSTWQFMTRIEDTAEGAADRSLLQGVHCGNCIREQ